jgi:fatty-acid desaturase
MLFAKENRPKIKEDNPDMTFGQIGKELGEMWRAPSDKEKQEFKERGTASLPSALHRQPKQQPSTASDEKTTKSNDNKTTMTTTTPWWRAGGILRPGQRFNIHAPAFFIAWHYEVLLPFGIAWTAFYLYSKYVCRMTTETCLYSISSYVCTVVICLIVMGQTVRNAAALFAFLIALASLKIAICSSACLHRYCAHTAYKTDSTAMKLFICIVGCLANQGGPIWWASQHRCHHKHCEQPDDPHSPTLVGFENAFAFFNSNPKLMKVNIDYVPPYLDAPIFWVVDTFYWAFCTIEMVIAGYFYGVPGVAISYMSGFMCQLAGMYFNVIFHLSENHDKEGDHGKCLGIDFGQYWTNVPVYYPGFFVLSLMVPFGAPVSGEMYHGIHHEQPQLAYRNLIDLGYWFFVFPLQKLGLIYDVYESKKVL